MNQNRITITGDTSPASYTVTILVTKDGAPAANTEVSYYLDNGDPVWATTDSEGKLIITIPNGPHGLSLSKEQEQIYLNNYTGAGVINVENERVFPSLEYQTPAVKPETPPEEQPEKQPEKRPDTGDDSNWMLWMSLMVLSSIGIVVSVSKRNRL